MRKLRNIFCIVFITHFVSLASAYSGIHSYSGILGVDMKNKIDQYVLERNFSELEKMIELLLKEKNETTSCTLTRVYYYIAGMPDILNILNEWCEKSPQSYIPLTARGIFYIDYAWEARGSGYKHTVSDANAELFKKRLLQAKEDLELAYTKSPNDGNVPASLIVVAMGLNLKREYMEMQFSNTVKADPFNYKAYWAKLEYLMPKWHGSKEEAEAFVNKIKKTVPEGAKPRLLIATFYSSLYDYKGLYWILRQDEKIWVEIQDEFQKYLALYPEDMFAHSEFSELAFYAGKYETAMREFGIIGENPDEDVWTNEQFHTAKITSKAFCLIDKGDWKSAEEELAADPRARGFGYIVGRFQYYRDNEGLELFLNKLRDSGREAQYHMLKGLSFENENKLTEALVEYDNALKLNPSYSEAYVNAGHVYEKTGDLKQAMDFYQKGIDTDSKNAVAYYDLGRVYEDALGEHLKAIPLIEAAIAAAPDNGAWYYLLGKAYENIDNHDKCIESWEKYLKIEPKGIYADFIRSSLSEILKKKEK